MSLIAELKRRNVFRVGVAYAIVAWLLIQVADVAFPPLKLPDWTLTLVAVLLIMGFPLALIFAWAFELTPEGIKPAKEVAPAESIRRLTGRKLDFAIIGLLVIAVVYFAVDKFIFQAERKQAEPTALPGQVAEAVEREKSIAVLLFDNLSRDAANEPFTKVIARTSMERLDPTLSIPEIGTQLGVATVLEGGVQRVGEHVRINVQLIDCKTEAHLWAETYDRELTAANVFSIQSDVAKTVADALQATLSPGEQAQLATVPTDNLAAYQAYLLGKQFLAKETTADVSKAMNHFRRAVELDPGFALAYVGLADGYIYQNEFSGRPPKEMLDKAMAAIETALRLDEKLGEAHSSLAAIRWFENDLAGAEAAFKRALELNSNYASAYYWYGNLLGRDLGRPEEGMKLICLGWVGSTRPSHGSSVRSRSIPAMRWATT
jgi:TolB-like protein